MGANYENDDDNITNFLFGKNIIILVSFLNYTQSSEKPNFPILSKKTSILRQYFCLFKLFNKTIIAQYTL